MTETKEILSDDATHWYHCPHQGETVVKRIKDHHKNGSYVTAVVWSNTTHRWRRRAERILPDRTKPC